MRIVVTDLTRFQNQELLCLAGLTEDGQQCIRPLSASKPGYLSFTMCKKLNILPGTILDGTFTTPLHIDAPHIEDMHYSDLKTVGAVDSTEFQSILEKSSTTSIKSGFGCTSKPTDKVLTTPPAKSIITLKLNPRQFQVVQNKFDNETIKAHLTDSDGLKLSFLSISDLGFYVNVGQSATRKISAKEITEFIQEQDELFVRLGLGRKHISGDGREGYWMQVNGIYTFPDYQKIVRTYE
ncbi:MAG: hypothetical protein DID89_2727548343 [Candidatus Nitrotoga sp. CP45]|nr:MAG: hypothetical protein DID89_2727548343 [Candidatus Nitrotoga sp. CP45]